MDNRIDSPSDSVATSPATSTSGETSPARYPKRKRSEVKYLDSDDDDDYIPSDTEEVYRPPVTKRLKESKPLTNGDIFPFMKLPPELRNKIYGECLRDNDAIYLIDSQASYRRTAVRATLQRWKNCTRKHDRGWRWGDADASRYKAKPMTDTLKPLSPHLLSVSKAVYAEAANVLYGQPIVVVDNVTLFNFASTMTPRTAAMLRNITVAFWCHTAAHRQMNYAAMTLLAAVGAVHLDRLNLDCRLRPYGASGDLVARRVYRDCYSWILAVGVAKAENLAALDMLQMGDVNFHAWQDQRPPEMRKADIEKNRKLFQKELKRLIQRGAQF